MTKKESFQAPFERLSGTRGEFERKQALCSILCGARRRGTAGGHKTRRRSYIADRDEAPDSERVHDAGTASIKRKARKMSEIERKRAQKTPQPCMKHDGGDSRCYLMKPSSISRMTFAATICVCSVGS